MIILQQTFMIISRQKFLSLLFCSPIHQIIHLFFDAQMLLLGVDPEFRFNRFLLYRYPMLYSSIQKF